MTILEWAKANAKDGANFAELEELVERANPLSGVKSVAEAEVFMKDHQVLKSAFDSSVSKAVQNHDDKFMAEKFPELLKGEREKIRQELNPKESEEQKQIRELREELAAQKRARDSESLKTQLRGKASELSISPDMADTFVVHGENAMSRFEAFAEKVNTTIKDRVAEEVKGKFKGQRTPEAGKPVGDNVITRGEWDGMSAQSQSEFIAKGGAVTENE